MAIGENRVRLACAAGIAVVLLLGACSSGSSGGESGATTAQTEPAGVTDRAGFLEAGNAICREIGPELAAFDQDIKSQEKSPASVARLLNGYADYQERTLKGLQALPQPEDPNGDLAVLYASQRDYIDAARSAAIAAEANDEAGYEPLVAAMNQAASEGNQAYDSYGLTDCGGGAAGLQVA